MSNAERLRERFNKLTLDNPRSLNRVHRRPRALNRTDEQLAIRTSTEHVPLSKEDYDLLKEALDKYCEVAAFYQRKLPLTDAVDKTVLSLYMRNSHKAPQDAIIDIVQGYIEKQIDDGRVVTDLPSDRAKFVKAVNFVMTKTLKDANKI